MEEVESRIRRCNPVHFKENSDLESGLFSVILFVKWNLFVTADNEQKIVDGNVMWLIGSKLKLVIKILAMTQY